MRQDDLLSPPTSASALADQIAAEIRAAGGWIGFERYMALALYSPGLGYYARGDRQFGALPSSGSDFITAPQLSPLFGRALARQVLEALQATGTREVWEFGAGSGALAAQLLASLGEQIERYTIVDLSGTLRARQRQTVAEQVPQWADKLHFADRLPEQLDAVVVGNELLDAMPVVLLHFDGRHWLERGVTLAKAASTTAPRFVWADRPTTLQPPDTSGDPAGRLYPTGTVTELPRQASAFVTTLAGVLRRGAAFLIDYGFPEHEFYHPQRSGGTLMCHRAHQADPDPLDAPGEKDITAHVDFTAIALAGQDAGLEVLGYTSQARFLLNCGLADDLLIASNHDDFAALAAGQKLITEHEMGELFKVIGFAAAATPFAACGFAAGDRSHTL
ncbi:MAG: class I SAM-dependent methyltransferase [Leptothrix sp. (in: b-proteobacteria)]